ncbi:eukaryotic translation initiation factor 2c [Phlyctema vagabunda]|uniref:Eukaryotic translation initiation factor 2c n=1 Tax=Phlyctema vagabunda TaxID=108571 RepID=A0ABR4PSL6_9HELO
MSGPPRQNPYPQGLGYDPAKPTASKQSMIVNKNIDLPQSAYKLDGAYNGLGAALPGRPGYNTQGREISIKVNQYKVLKYPQKDIYQYDIKIGNGAEKRGLIMKIWKSKTLQARLQKISPFWLWNGDQIAWCDAPMPRGEERMMVDLDAEQGRTPREGKDPNVYKVIISQTKSVRLAIIEAFLSRKIQFDNSVLEAITFLDHLLRQSPQEQFTSIKRSYFARGRERKKLDYCIEAMKGVYSSLRLCDIKPSVGNGTGVALNIDVANGVFWTPQNFAQAARNFCSANNQSRDFQVFRNLLAPAQSQKGTMTYSESFKELRKMQKLRFTVTYRGKQEAKVYVVKSFTFPKVERDEKHNYAREGQNARNTYFPWKKPDGTVQKTSIEEFLRQKYNHNLEYPYLPLIETERAGQFPMESCMILPDQQYKFKLSPKQTQEMIKFAVTRPKERSAAIHEGVEMLKWSQDPYLRHYGMQIEPNMSTTKARLLPAPDVMFKTGKATPGTFGSWDLKGKTFLTPNTVPLQAWGFANLDQRLPVVAVQEFAKVFIQIYGSHGGNIANKTPIIYTAAQNEEISATVTKLRQTVGSKFQMNPQILFFIMGDRNSTVYERIKKNVECRYVNFSQVLNSAHITKKNPQYCSNVAMKVNAKLGGSTMRASIGNNQNLFPPGSMFIGADVSHASPGSPQGSMAALTMSMDKYACRYSAAVQTNGRRVEMITEGNLRSMLIPLFNNWMNTVAKEALGAIRGPSQIFYFRDGVSEGQYQHVLDQEVKNMKKILIESYGARAGEIKWTVVVCSKRHHIRFFPTGPRDGDKNQNALPGTLVERDVTHPFEYDFYLTAHKAIQGTARPVHYHVLMDEAKTPPNNFHTMINAMCYQYQRATTSVSMFPAVYYAHLASNRARAHEHAAHSEGPRGGQKFVEQHHGQVAAGAAGGQIGPSTATGSSMDEDVRPLLPLGGSDSSQEDIKKLRVGMWYI